VQAGLELLYGLGDRRLRHIELARGAGDRGRIEHALEDQQGPQLEPVQRDGRQGRGFVGHEYCSTTRLGNRKESNGNKTQQRTALKKRVYLGFFGEPILYCVYTR